MLVQMARYNLWANKLIIDTMLPLKDDLVNMEIASSFPSLCKTVYHMWSAEDIWVQRLLLVEQPVWAETGFSGSFAEAVKKWQQASKKLATFAEKQFSDDSFNHVMQYHNLKKLPVKVPVYVGLMQAFNHATYHRGQLVTMLRQAGVTKIPAMDFYLFAMK